MGQDHRNYISSILCLQPAREAGNYLGLPLSIPRSKRKACKDIQEKVSNRLVGWKARSLSQVGWTVLIQSVATAIPSYYMSVFILPKTISRDIDRHIKNFWWGFDGASRRFHPKAWEQICKPKQ